MTVLNASIPPIKIFLRAEYLYDLKSNFGEYENAMLFGISSRPNRALGFHILTDRGVVFSDLPINSFSWKECEKKQLQELEMWNAFSYNVTVNSFSYLKGLRCSYLGIDMKWHFGNYLFTVDWYGGFELDLSLAEEPSEHKCAHFIKLEDGNYALQPNNRIKWQEASFITRPFSDRPKYLVSTKIFDAETWGRTEDTDRFMYGSHQSGAV